MKQAATRRDGRMEIKEVPANGLCCGRKSGMMKHILERRAQDGRAWLCTSLQQQFWYENMQKFRVTGLLRLFLRKSFQNAGMEGWFPA